MLLSARQCIAQSLELLDASNTSLPSLIDYPSYGTTGRLPDLEIKSALCNSAFLELSIKKLLIVFITSGGDENELKEN